MDILFEVIFLEEAFNFLSSLHNKHYKKILSNIRKAQIELDAELFKKLTNDIWEFRTLYQGLQYRLLAFWDKTSVNSTLVIVVFGLVKKQSKMPENTIKKAMQIRKKYFYDKHKINKK